MLRSPVRSTVRLRNAGGLRILDFDIETRKIGFHTGGEFGPDGCEPVTIAASWVGSRDIMVWLQPDLTLPEMLAEFVAAYNQADIVTGHYIRKFDLPVINGALFEHGLPLLGAKRAVDTKGDLVAFQGLSKSQENLAGTLEIPEAKYHMSDYKWRRSSRLTAAGVEETRKRASCDVRQHKALRLALLACGALRPPRMWTP